jgi:tetratricopeptide (TPR) repeat protein
MSNWRTTIPQIAIEAVLARNIEHVEAEEAIEELLRTSLIDKIISESDKMSFLSIPLSAVIFGKKKLSVSSLKTAIEADTKLLNTFGAGLTSDVRWGVGPRINKFFKEVSRRISIGKEKIEVYTPTLEYLCRKFPHAWVLLSDLYVQENRPDFAAVALQNYIENINEEHLKSFAWNKLTGLYKKLGDWVGESHALVELCELPSTDIEKTYQCVCRINMLFKEHSVLTDTYEKKIMVQKLVEVYKKKLEADKLNSEASYYSQLAWLYLHLVDRHSARDAVSSGLTIDPYNQHCLKLKDMIGL